MTLCNGSSLKFFRIGTGLLLLCHGLCLFADFDNLFGHTGIIRPEIMNHQANWLPRAEVIRQFIDTHGVDFNVARAAFGLYLTSVVAMILGARQRTAAFCALLTHTFWVTNGPIYGLDAFTSIALFHIAVFAEKDDQSVEVFLFSIRSILCLVYFAGGIEKAMGVAWWDGDAMWRVMHFSERASFVRPLMIHYPFLAVAAGIGTVLLEVLYAPLILFGNSRRTVIWGIVMMHCGIAVLMGLEFFSGLMIILNLSAWTAFDRSRIFERVARLSSSRQAFHSQKAES